MAQGAAATHLGPRALGLAAALNKGLGLTMRKTCAVLRALAGLTITPGGLSQALARMGRRLGPAHAALVGRVMAEPVLHTDETSWYAGRPGASRPGRRGSERQRLGGGPREIAAGRGPGGDRS